MHNQMTINGRCAHHAPRELLLVAFWVVALVGFGFLIGAARGPVAAATDGISPAETTIEDWHGNVRRSD